MALAEVHGRDHVVEAVVVQPLHDGEFGAEDGVQTVREEEDASGQGGEARQPEACSR